MILSSLSNRRNYASELFTPEIFTPEREESIEKPLFAMRNCVFINRNWLNGEQSVPMGEVTERVSTVVLLALINLVINLCAKQDTCICREASSRRKKGRGRAVRCTRADPLSL